MTTIETLEQALDIYFASDETGFIRAPSFSMCDEVNGGFEIRNGSNLLAFVSYNGSLVDADEYLGAHPDREEI